MNGVKTLGRYAKPLPAPHYIRGSRLAKNIGLKSGVFDG
jgi:hypothetical protein